jgi:hypothetical protein
VLFFVKVRIDIAQMDEMGRRLADGSLDRSALRSTHCHRFDPEVGLNIWEADTPAEFWQRFAPHRTYYRDLIEVTPVITSGEAMQLLLESR